MTLIGGLKQRLSLKTLCVKNESYAGHRISNSQKWLDKSHQVNCNHNHGRTRPHRKIGGLLTKHLLSAADNSHTSVQDDEYLSFWHLCVVCIILFSSNTYEPLSYRSCRKTVISANVNIFFDNL